ncbi:hypothetical protein, partial [Colwellia echini]|uniref:hypothetical protein n=1 Tax=Colwellia echini TaxID=1982103 RepID=UPI001B878FE1
MNKNLITIALALSLSACGDGTTSTPAPKDNTPKDTASSIDVTVIDGYIRGATAFVDINLNGLKDDGEPSVITSEGGRGIIVTTDLNIDPANAVIVVDIPAGAVDEDTITEENPDGVPFETAFQLVSLPGENIATPLTTLISMTAAANATGSVTAQDIEAAKLKVATSLGLTIEQITADYLATDNQALAEVASLLVSNSVLPKTVTGQISSEDLLVASVVTEKINKAVKEAQEAGNTNRSVIESMTADIITAVKAFVEENSESIAEGNVDNLATDLSSISETIANAYSNLIKSTETVTQEQIDSASQSAKDELEGTVVGGGDTGGGDTGGGDTGGGDTGGGDTGGGDTGGGDTGGGDTGGGDTGGGDTGGGDTGGGDTGGGDTGGGDTGGGDTGGGDTGGGDTGGGDTGGGDTGGGDTGGGDTGGGDTGGGDT